MVNSELSLVDIIRTIAGKKTEATTRYVEGSFFVQGIIQEVFGSGGIMVNASGMNVMAKAVTDEPMSKGMRVWVSSTADKTAWLIHGAVR